MLCAAVAVAAPGDLDSSFGVFGRVFVQSPFTNALTQQRDGKLLVGRFHQLWPLDDFSVMRLNQDGTLDASFGDNGRTRLEFPSAGGLTQVVLQQSDGKVVAAGYAGLNGSTQHTFGLARYNADGTPDFTFGQSGFVMQDLGGVGSEISAIVQQPDGRLVVAGRVRSASTSSSGDTAFARFNTDGSLDTSFGTNGILIFNGVLSRDFNFNINPVAVTGLIQQPDGKLVAVGAATNSSGVFEAAAIRLSPAGSPDPTFDGDGRVTVSFPGGDAVARSLAVQPDGKLVLLGSVTVGSASGSPSIAAIARLNTDGSLDASFGNGGRSTIALGANDVIGSGSLALEPGGTILIAGISWPYDVIVARLTPAGQLDRSFGVQGRTIIDQGSSFDSSNAVTSANLIRQSDGNILVMCNHYYDWDGNGGYFILARLLASGSFAGIVGFPLDGVSVSESAGAVTIAVRRTGGSSGVVSVDYKSTGSDAKSGVDFTATAGSLNWADGDSADKFITVNIIDDTTAEQTESFNLQLSNATGGAGLAATKIWIQIQDNDAPPPTAPAPLPPTPITSTPVVPAPESSPANGGGGAIDWLTLMALLATLLLRIRVQDGEE